MEVVTPEKSLGTVIGDFNSHHGTGTRFALLAFSCFGTFLVSYQYFSAPLSVDVLALPLLLDSMSSNSVFGRGA